MSIVSESNPWCAMTSAEKGLGIATQPFAPAPPFAQMARSVFSLTVPLLSELRPAHDAEVAPAAEPEVLGLLEVGERRDVGFGVREVGLHRPDREPDLLLDLLEPRVVPLERRHPGLSQIRLVEVHLRRRHAEPLVGVERVAAEVLGVPPAK